MRGKAGRVPDRLQDIREAIGNARNDLGSLTKEQFLADGKTQRAVIESIIVIGEAANNVSGLHHTSNSKPRRFGNISRTRTTCGSF